MPLRRFEPSSRCSPVVKKKRERFDPLPWSPLRLAAKPIPSDGLAGVAIRAVYRLGSPLQWVRTRSHRPCLRRLYSMTLTGMLIGHAIRFSSLMTLSFHYTPRTIRSAFGGCRSHFGPVLQWRPPHGERSPRAGLVFRPIKAGCRSRNGTSQR